MGYHNDPPGCDDLRIEAVTTCVGFDDILDVTLGYNHAQLDTMIVITSNEDKRTQGVAKKHGAICVQTDLFRKNQRVFNKGAAINAGFGHFQYHGWRLHLDSDIILPDNFRRLMFNHSFLDKDCIYGADRVDVLHQDLKRYINQQHLHSCLLIPPRLPLSARYIHMLHGYVPIGYFQMWHAKNQHSYPYSLGTAAHDDVLFAIQWPVSQRRQLPGAVCYHMTTAKAQWGENWEGKRKQPRLDNVQPAQPVQPVEGEKK